MGSCMSSSSGDGGVSAQPKSKSKTKAFQGTVSILFVLVWFLDRAEPLFFHQYICDWIQKAESQTAAHNFLIVWFHVSNPQGNRLGSANEPPPTSSAVSGNSKPDTDLPAKRVDPSLTQSDRDRQREARLAAAEKRQKASGVSTKKKKPTNPSQPLRGPNSEYHMRWTAWVNRTDTHRMEHLARQF